MARNIFISFLGTSNYSECIYVAEDKDGNKHEQKLCRYIQEATLRWLMESEGFAKGDRMAYILMTETSRIKNWENDGHRDRETNAVIHQQGLGAIMHSIGVPHEAVTVPEGKDEKEILDIFRILYDKVKEGDKLYMDLTHGYRFMPMVMLVLGNYAKLLKKGVEIKSITYGNFEGRDRKTNKAPIVDLIQLSLIQDWTIAASQFINAGSAKMLETLTMNEIRPILKASKGADANAVNLRKGMNSLVKFTDYLSFCRGRDVVEAKDLMQIIEAFGNLEAEDVMIEPLKPILNLVMSEVAALGAPKSYENCLKVASWCYDHGLFQQAITFIVEGVISVIVGKYIGDDVNDKNLRGLVNSSLTPAASVISSKGTKSFEQCVDWGFVKGDRNIVRRLGQMFIDISLEDGLVCQYYDRVVKRRNDIDHGGFRKDPLEVKKLKEAFKFAIEAAEKIVSRLPDVLPTLPERSKLFLNISNHPSEKWGEQQLTAAKALGEVVDLPFPTVDQSASEEEIGKLADGMVTEIMTKWPDCDITAHIMGELTLTFALVRKLSAKGVMCVASTTERIVVDNPDGTKTSKFSFCQFRAFAI